MDLPPSLMMMRRRRSPDKWRSPQQQQQAFVRQEERALLRQALWTLQGLPGPNLHWQSSNNDDDGATMPWQPPTLTTTTVLLSSSSHHNDNHIDDYDDDDYYYWTPSPLLGQGYPAVLQRLGQAGWYYTRIVAYIESCLTNHHHHHNNGGAIQRALATALAQEVQDYRAWWVQTEQMYAAVWEEGNHDDDDDDGTSPTDNIATSTTTTTSSSSQHYHLRQLLVAAHGPTDRLRCLAALTEGLTVALQGAPLLRALAAHVRAHVDTTTTLRTTLLTAAAQPWWDMVTDWVTQGWLPARPEFFVVQQAVVAVVEDKGGVPPSSSQHTHHHYHPVQDNHLYAWRHRYQLDPTQMPPTELLPPDLVQQAWQVGRAVHFVRHCLADGQYTTADRAVVRAALTYQPSAVDGSNTAPLLRTTLDDMATRVNRHILQSLRGDHHLRLHMYCLKQFLLLGQGDFVANLTQALHQEYETDNAGIAGIYRHTLASLTESALRSSNATRLPDECLQRLQVELRLAPDDPLRYHSLGAAATDRDTRTVWDIFQLDYTLPDPVRAIIEPTLMDDYRNLFVHLFGLRKIEYFLNFTWRQSAMLSHALQSTAQYSGIKASTDPYYARAVVLLRRIAITRQAMINFLVILKSFLMLEVIEGGWKLLEHRLNEADSLDELMEAHEHFVRSICRQSLLRRRDDQDRDEITEAVNDLLHLCNEFSIYQRNLFGTALQLADKAAEKRRRAAQRARQGDWGFDEVENTQTEETTFFGLSDETKLQDLDDLSSMFHETILILLRALDRKLHGPSHDDAVTTPLATPPPIAPAKQVTVDEYTRDNDLKLLRYLRSQLDHNEFYQQDV